MQFELRRLTDYSDEAILNEIRRVAQVVRHPTLSRTEFRKHSRVSPTTISRRFGGWEKALAVAGLGSRFDASNKPISEDEVVAELQRVAKLLAVQSVSREQFNAHARFTDDTVRNRFGSWHKAMKAAGLLTNALGKRYTDEDCFENLLTVWTQYGRAPTHDEMKRPPSVVGPKAYMLRFGTWTKALQAFIDRVNADASPLAEKQDDDQEPSLARKRVVPEADRREIRLGLRYLVLKRDCFRCVICGRSPATHLGLVLHVDHILAWAKGGKTVIENLRSLCDDCNLGKGSKHEEG
jgi:hypothetical protein